MSLVNGTKRISGDVEFNRYENIAPSIYDLMSIYFELLEVDKEFELWCWETILSESDRVYQPVIKGEIILVKGENIAFVCIHDKEKHVKESHRVRRVKASEPEEAYAKYYEEINRILINKVDYIALLYEKQRKVEVDIQKLVDHQVQDLMDEGHWIYSEEADEFKTYCSFLEEHMEEIDHISQEHLCEQMNFQDYNYKLELIHEICSRCLNALFKIRYKGGGNPYDFMDRYLETFKR